MRGRRRAVVTVAVVAGLLGLTTIVGTQAASAAPTAPTCVAGIPAPAGLAARTWPVMDPSGRYVAYSTQDGLPALGSPYDGRLVLADLVAGTSEVIGRAPDGSIVPAAYRPLSVSSDGRFVAFSSYTDNIVPGVPAGIFTRTYLRDRRGHHDPARLVRRRARQRLDDPGRSLHRLHRRRPARPGGHRLEPGSLRLGPDSRHLRPHPLRRVAVDGGPERPELRRSLPLQLLLRPGRSIRPDHADLHDDRRLRHQPARHLLDRPLHRRRRGEPGEAGGVGRHHRHHHPRHRRRRRRRGRRQREGVLLRWPVPPVDRLRPDGLRLRPPARPTQLRAHVSRDDPRRHPRWSRGTTRPARSRTRSWDARGSTSCSRLPATPRSAR